MATTAVISLLTIPSSVSIPILGKGLKRDFGVWIGVSNHKQAAVKLPARKHEVRHPGLHHRSAQFMRIRERRHSKLRIYRMAKVYLAWILIMGWWLNWTIKFPHGLFLFSIPRFVLGKDKSHDSYDRFVNCASGITEKSLFSLGLFKLDLP